VVLGDATDADVFAIADDELEMAVQVFHVRGGRRPRPARLGRREGCRDVPTSSSTCSCRSTATSRPRASPRGPRAGAAPEARGGGACSAPARREGRGAGAAARRQAHLMETVERNAEQSLARHKVARAGDLTARAQALEELQEALGLDQAPLRIECFDVSHVQGTNVVASMVVFEDGLARKSEYRRFIVRRRSARSEQPSTTRPPCARSSPGASGAISPSGPEVPPRPGDDGHRRQEVRLSAQPRRRRRRAPAGQRGRRRPARVGRRRRGGRRPGQATGRGVAARRRLPGHPAPRQRGALPAPAGPRRGAPVRHHLPPRAAQQGDDELGAGRHTRAGAGASARRCSSVRLG
jgi:hypothetical protein